MDHDIGIFFRKFAAFGELFYCVECLAGIAGIEDDSLLASHVVDGLADVLHRIVIGAIVKISVDMKIFCFQNCFQTVSLFHPFIIIQRVTGDVPVRHDSDACKFHIQMLVCDGCRKTHIGAHAPDGDDYMGICDSLLPDLGIKFQGAVVIAQCAQFVRTAHGDEVDPFPLLLPFLCDPCHSVLKKLTVRRPAVLANQIYLASHDPVQQKVGGNLSRIRIHRHDGRTESVAGGDRRSQSAVIGLRSAYSQEHRRTAVLRILYKIFQLPELVTACSVVGQIVPFHVEPDPQLPRYGFQLLQRSWRVQKTHLFAS